MPEGISVRKASEAQLRPARAQHRQFYPSRLRKTKSPPDSALFWPPSGRQANRVLQAPPFALQGRQPQKARCQRGLASGRLRKPNSGQRKPNIDHLSPGGSEKPNPQLVPPFFGLQVVSFPGPSGSKLQAIVASRPQDATGD